MERRSLVLSFFIAIVLLGVMAVFVDREILVTKSIYFTRAMIRPVTYAAERRAHRVPRSHARRITADQDDNIISLRPSGEMTLQEALDAVEPGMHIQLANGVYPGGQSTVSSGTQWLPIFIEPVDGAHPIIDGGGDENGLTIEHDNYIVRGIEWRQLREGIRIQGARNVQLVGNTIHDVVNECVRLRYQAQRNVVRNNVIYDCGQGDNGEGIYLGTAPEQRDKNDGQPDYTTHNVIRANEIYDVTEGIDVKEDASFNDISRNVVHHTTDVNSGGINVRSDSNVIKENVSFNNQGAGFRFGGDVAFNAILGSMHDYGKRNQVNGNVALLNGHSGYKFMNGPQFIDCSNGGIQGNNRPLYYFGDKVEPFVDCQSSLPPDFFERIQEITDYLTSSFVF